MYCSPMIQSSQSPMIRSSQSPMIRSSQSPIIQSSQKMKNVYPCSEAVPTPCWPPCTWFWAGVPAKTPAWVYIGAPTQAPGGPGRRPMKHQGLESTNREGKHSPVKPALLTELDSCLIPSPAGGDGRKLEEEFGQGTEKIVKPALAKELELSLVPDPAVGDNKKGTETLSSSENQSSQMVVRPEIKVSRSGHQSSLNCKNRRHHSPSHASLAVQGIPGARSVCSTWGESTIQYSTALYSAVQDSTEWEGKLKRKIITCKNWAENCICLAILSTLMWWECFPPKWRHKSEPPQRICKCDGPVAVEGIRTDTKGTGCNCHTKGKIPWKQREVVNALTGNLAKNSQLGCNQVVPRGLCGPLHMLTSPLGGVTGPLGAALMGSCNKGAGQFLCTGGWRNNLPFRPVTNGKIGQDHYKTPPPPPEARTFGTFAQDECFYPGELPVHLLWKGLPSLNLHMRVYHVVLIVNIQASATSSTICPRRVVSISRQVTCATLCGKDCRGQSLTSVFTSAPVPRGAHRDILTRRVFCALTVERTAKPNPASIFTCASTMWC